MGLITSRIKYAWYGLNGSIHEMVKAFNEKVEELSSAVVNANDRIYEYQKHEGEIDRLEEQITSLQTQLSQLRASLSSTTDRLHEAQERAHSYHQDLLLAHARVDRYAQAQLNWMAKRANNDPMFGGAETVGGVAGAERPRTDEAEPIPPSRVSMTSINQLLSDRARKNIERFAAMGYNTTEAEYAFEEEPKFTPEPAKEAIT